MGQVKMSRSGPLTTLIISGSHHYYYLFINKDLITYSVHYTLSLIIFLINVSLFVLFITLSLSLSLWPKVESVLSFLFCQWKWMRAKAPPSILCNDSNIQICTQKKICAMRPFSILFEYQFLTWATYVSPAPETSNLYVKSFYKSSFRAD